MVDYIQAQTQQISDDLSLYLKESLQIQLHPNPIQFPKFEFPSIDEQIKRQQETYTRYEKQTKYRTETRYKTEKYLQEGGLCQSLYYEDVSRPYQIEVPYQKTTKKTEYRDIFIIDLQQISQDVQQKIDVQVKNSKTMLERIVHKQIIEYFKSAEQQIDNYIQKFQYDLELLQKERSYKETQAEEIRQKLEEQKRVVEGYLEKLIAIRRSLNSWQPSQIIEE